MKKVFYLIFILILAVQIHAQWVQTNGPCGGDISCLAVQVDSSGSSRIFAGVEGEIYISTDDASSWKRTGFVPPEEFCYVTSFAVNDSFVFAGTNYYGIYRSSDNGLSWFRTEPGLTGYNTVLAVSGKNIFAVSSEHVYISTDNGITWKLASAGLPEEGGILTLAVLGNIIFAGTYNNGICLSTNNGVMWTQVNSGLPEMTTVYDFAVRGTDIFAGTMQGIYLSTNYGTSWIRADSGIPRDINGLSFIRALTLSGKNIYAGVSNPYRFTTDNIVYRSTDGGVSWDNSSFDVLKHTVIIDLAASGDYVLAGTADGIYRTDDDGKNWAEADSGIKSTYIRTLLLRGTSLYAGGWQWVQLSTNNGENWNKVGSFAFESPGIEIDALAALGNRLFAGGSLYDSLSVRILIAFFDGKNWIKADSGLPKSSYYGDFYLSTLKVIGNNIFAGISQWVGKGSSAGIYVSKDTGKSWMKFSKGLPENLQINDLASIGAEIFAGTDSGIYVLNDNNATWKAANSGLPLRTYVHSLAVCDSHLFAGTSDGVMLYNNKDKSWNSVNKGLPYPEDIYSSPVLAANKNKIFTGYITGQIFISTDYGKSWTDFSSGLPAVYISSLAADDNYLFAGLYGRGVWKRKLSEIIADVKSPPEVRLKFSLKQNYPNPFNPSTTINFSLPYSSHVTLKIFDLLGCEVARLIDEELPAGIHDVTWKADNISSGIYFYEINAGSFIQTKKMILLR